MGCTILTAVFSFAGMLMLAASVVIEIIENHRAKLLVLETTDFPDVLTEGLEQQKQDFRTQYRSDKLKAVRRHFL